MPKKIVIPARDDLWDAAHERFVNMKEHTLVLEHSLISISKWEQKWKKPFISDKPRSYEESYDYIRCMTLNQVDDMVYNFLTPENLQEIEEYMADPMTATTFSDMQQHGKKEVITSEIIYYQMISFGIPIEFEKWHFNRLVALIRVFAIKNGDTKKMSPHEAAMYQRAINDKRLASRAKRRS